jgi:hypothetical protein
VCWIGTLAHEGCRKRSCWTMDRSFAGERWRRGAKNAECGSSAFSLASIQNAYAESFNARLPDEMSDRELVHEFK